MRRRPFRFGVTCELAADRGAWRTLCRRVEDLGCSTLYVSDHFGDQLALIPALAAAAEATTTLRVGALVACNDYRHPVMYAKELATLDVLSGGRVDWGIGAGWVEPEYERVGLPFDAPGVRVDRMFEAVAVMKGLFADGPVTFTGRHYRVRDLEGTPKPQQRPHPPLLIGGQGKRILSFAAREADVIGIAPSLSGRSLGDAPPRQSVEAAVDEQVAWIRAAAPDRVDDLELNMVAFPCAITDDALGAATNIGPAGGLTPDEALRAPHMWIGSLERIADELQHHRERWGISSWAIPSPQLDRVAPLIERLADT